MPAMMPVGEPTAIVFAMHGTLLRRLSQEAGVHFSGLAVAARHFRQQGGFPNRLHKRLRDIDMCFNILRHVTAVGAETMVEDIVKAVRPPDDAVSFASCCSSRSSASSSCSTGYPAPSSPSPVAVSDSAAVAFTSNEPCVVTCLGTGLQDQDGDDQVEIVAATAGVLSSLGLSSTALPDIDPEDEDWDGQPS